MEIEMDLELFLTKTASMLESLVKIKLKEEVIMKTKDNSLNTSGLSKMVI